MSHTDNTLQETLEQHLEALKTGDETDEWMRDLLEWLLQEVLDLEFSQFLGAAPYPVGHRDGVNAARIGRDIETAIINGSFSPG